MFHIFLYVFPHKRQKNYINDVYDRWENEGVTDEEPHGTVLLSRGRRLVSKLLCELEGQG